MITLRTAVSIVLLGPFALSLNAADLNPFAEKDPVIARYKAALAKNDFEEAVSVVCDAAKTDPKKYEKRCINAQEDANKQLQRYDAAFAAGRTKYAQKDYTGAIHDLTPITFGPHHVEALALIHDANEGLSHPQRVIASKAAFGAAQAAYLRGDFTAARQNADKVTVIEVQPMAQQLLANIHTYEDAMKQGEKAAADHNYSVAQQKYNFALQINPNGPGSPSSRLDELATLIVASKTAPVKSATTKADTASTQTNAGNSKKNAAQNAGANAAQNANQSDAQNADKLKAALAEAHAAEENRNADAALAAYERALALNPRQPDALAGRQRLLDAAQKSGNELEGRVASGIRSYYKSRFTESADALSLYLKAGGNRSKGAAHFYLGAAFANQALLAGNLGDVETRTLRDLAMHEFQLARREHYQPIQKYLSPRVIALWNESPG